jgi:hypothetical protein
MQFRTKITIPKGSNPIDYNSRIVSLGSCFAENMVEKLDYFKFQNTCNPFGIIFNPVSIEKIIYRTVNQFFYTTNDIFFHNEHWHCYEVHSDFSSSDKNKFLQNLNEILESTHQQIIESSHIIITYGTSWVYRNIGTKLIVANCHKVPQKEFFKEILSVETIENSIKNSIGLIRKINPNVNFIFTASPVRHIKDGFVENQRSKAHLITAIHKVLESEIWNLEPAIYFPSYEIMMDELRDYRFYAEDMLHPNQVAINYIWERFFETQIKEESHSIAEEVGSIQKGLQHRPFNPDSEGHLQFKEKLREKIETLVSQYSFMKF